MFLATSDSTFFRLAERIDPNLLGAIGLISVVLTFIFLVVSTVTFCRTLQSLSLAKMQNQMINELLAKGYSVDEIQQLVTGSRRRNVLFRIFDRGRQAYINRPAAPVKSTV